MACAETVVAVAAGLVFSRGIGDPSPWRDEAATLSMTRRSLGAMADALTRVDLVHALYYLLVHPTQSLWPSVTSARLVSTVAFVGVVVLLVRLGRALGSATIGTTAAALTVASPLASRYAQDARPFALVTLAAVGSTYALVLAVTRTAPIPTITPTTRWATTTRPTRRPGSRRWAIYAATVVVLGVLNVLAVLLLMLHLALVAVLALGDVDGLPTGSPWAGLRSGLTRWALWTAGAIGVLLPFVVAAWSQHGQVSWIPVPHVYDLTGFYVQVFGSRLPVVLAVTAVGAVVVGTLWAPRTPRTPTGADGRQLRSGPAGTAFVVGAVWAGGPPVLLWTLSQVVPLWDLHYVLFCLPGVALLIASLPPLAASARASFTVSRAGFTVPRAGFTVPRAGFTVTQAVVSVLAVGVVLLVGVLGLPQQAAYRVPGSGHAEDLRGVAAYLRANALPGDAVVYSSAELRMLGALYPSAVAALDDVALARDPLASASLYGVEITPEALPAALANHPRVWLVRSSAGLPDAAPAVERAKLTDLEAGFRQASAAAITTIEVVLYLPR